MANHLERKQLEFKLSAMLRATEEKTLSNPKLKAMADQLRNSYQNDQAGFISMMGMGAPPPKKKVERVKLPESKIPQLLMILDSLATKKPLSLPPTAREINRDIPPSLLTSFEKDEEEIVNMTPSKKDNVRRILPANMVNDSLLSEVDDEILKSKAIYNSVKKEEGMIKSRKGKYALAVERLKAERVLREYPEMITHLEHKRKMIQEGILG